MTGRGWETFLETKLGHPWPILARCFLIWKRPAMEAHGKYLGSGMKYPTPNTSTKHQPNTQASLNASASPVHQKSWIWGCENHVVPWIFQVMGPFWSWWDSLCPTLSYILAYFRMFSNFGLPQIRAFRAFTQQRSQKNLLMEMASMGQICWFHEVSPPTHPTHSDV